MLPHHYELLYFRLCDSSARCAALNCATILHSCSSARRFVTQHAHHLLPHLVMEVRIFSHLLLLQTRLTKALLFQLVRNGVGTGNGGDTHSPVEFLAQYYGKKSRHMLADNFQFIFPHMVVNATNKQEYSKLVAFLETATGLPLVQLMPSSRQKVITELFTELHRRQKSVVSALQWLAKHEGFDKGERNKEKKMTQADPVSYVLPKLLGVLGYFDQRLTNPRVSASSKSSILCSLRAVVEFVGPKGIAEVKHKLLSTFKTAASLQGVPGSKVV